MSLLTPAKSICLQLAPIARLVKAQESEAVLLHASNETSSLP